jgi:hypothetical protein
MLSAKVSNLFIALSEFYLEILFANSIIQDKLNNELWQFICIEIIFKFI